MRGDAVCSARSVLSTMTEASKKLRIEYVKSQFFRVLHCDGAFGGTTPRLQLLITFYNERFPIPKVLTYDQTIAGAPGVEVLEERESKEGIIREVDVGVVLDLPAAKAFSAWLTAKISELETAREQVLGEHAVEHVQRIEEVPR